MARLVDVGQEAHGVVAIGQFATGVIAIGQIATGVVAIGQVSRGVIAVGMVAFGVFALGMGALGIGWSSGMIAVGGRVGRRMLGIPLVPYWIGRPTIAWGVIGVVQLAALVVASVVLWSQVVVPLGDALLGSSGILRSLPR